MKSNYIKFLNKFFLFDYLKSNKTFFHYRFKIISIVVLLLYLTTIIYTMIFHEFWRDEVRALSLALTPSSIFGLKTELLNEGHPILWYLILRVSYNIFQTNLVLPIVHMVIAFLAVFIFYRFSPFKNYQKILFIFGIFPIYEYSVMCRNYTLVMLFLFLFAYFFSKKKRNYFYLSLILAGLANSHAYGIFLAGLLLLLEICESYKNINKNNYKAFSFFIFFTFFMMLFAVSTVTPTANNVSDISNVTIEKIFDSLLYITSSSSKNSEIFPKLLDWNIDRKIIFFIFSISLIYFPLLAILGFSSILFLEIFSYIIYPSFLRHEGIIFIFFITLFWIALSRGGFLNKRSFRYKIFWINLYVIFPCLLIYNVHMGIDAISRDIFFEKSAGKKIAKFIKENSRYKNAIFLGEISLSLESLPYYLNNKIFQFSTYKYYNYVKLDSTRRPKANLKEMVIVAQKIKKRENKEVIIFLSPNIYEHVLKNNIEVRYYNFNRLLFISPVDIDYFNKHTKKIGTFIGALDENMIAFEVL